MHDHALGVAEGQPGDGRPVPAFRHFLDGEIEFLPGDEIDGGGSSQASFRIDRDLGADQARLEPRIAAFQGFDCGEIRGEGGRRGVQHGQVESIGLGGDFIQRNPM